MQTWNKNMRARFSGLFGKQERLEKPSPTRNKFKRALRTGIEPLESRRLLAVVSHWSADGTADDLVGGNDATLVGGASYETGQIGQAFSLDGLDDRVLIEDDPSLALTESLTIEAWVRADAYPDVGSRALFWRGDDRGGMDPYFLNVTNAGELMFGIHSETSGIDLFAPMPLGEFVHVAGTLDDSTGDIALYINGVQLEHGNTSARPFAELDPTLNPLVIIGNFNGLLDEVKLHDAALSASEVLSIYNAGKGTLQPTLHVGDVSVIEGLAESTLVNDFIDEGSGSLNSPRGIAVGPNGDVFVGSSDPPQVLRYDATGQFLGIFADATAGDDGRTGALGIFGDYLFVTTANNDSILRFELATGDPAPAAGQTGAVFVPSGIGGLDRPFGIEFDTAGDLYVPSLEGMNVLRFDGVSGVLVGEFVAASSDGVGDRALDLEFGPDGNLYVADGRESRVLRYQGPNGASPGQFMDVFIAPGSGGLDSIPSDGLAFGPDGDLYISNRDSDEILQFDGATGGFVEALSAAVPGTLNAPKGVVFDASGTLLVVSANTNSVVRSLNTTAAIIPVSLSAPSPTVVTVNYDTLDGTATGGLDYVTQNGSLTFAPGRRHKSVVVPIVDDLLNESAEEAYLTLSQVVGANIGNAGTITIADNDGPIELFSDSFEIGQWNGLWESVNRFRRSTNDSTAGNYAAETDGSWWNRNSSLTLADPIDLSAYSSVELEFDWKIESNWDNGEYLRLEFWDGSSWNVIRSLDGNGPDEGSWQMENVTIPASYLRDDFKFRFASRVSSSSEDGYVDNVRVTTSFVDDPEISVADGTLSELGDADGGVWVSLSGPASVPVSVNYSTVNGTAVAPGDYVALNGTLTFAPGEVTKKIIMRAWDDTDVEGSESYELVLSNPSGDATLGTAEATVTIVDDDASRQLSIEDVVVTETDNTLHYRGFLVETPVPQNFVSFGFGPNGDLYATSQSAGGAIDRYDGSTGELLERFVESGQIQGVRSPIFRDGFLYAGSEYSDEVLRFDANGEFYDVFVSAGAGGIDGPHGMTFGPDYNGDGVLELYVSGRNSDNVVRYDGVTGLPLGTYVTPGSGGLDGPEGLAFDPQGNFLFVASSLGPGAVRKYNATTGVYVEDAAAAPAISPKDVKFGPDGLMYVASAGNDSILRFTADGDFIDDYVPSGLGNIDDPIRFEIGADGNIYVSGSGIKGIARFGEDDEAAFTLTLSTPSAEPVTVDFTTDPFGANPATEGSDYLDKTGQVIFAPGVTQRVITVPVLDDALPESNESFQMTVSLPAGNLAGATILDGQGIATILDDGDVGNEPPVADAGADQSLSDNDGTGSETVTLNGSGVDPDGSIASYEWTDGSTVLGTTATISPSLAVGSHNLTLTVTDNEGATGSDTVVITVAANQAPTANAGADQSDSDADGSGDQIVTLSGAGSDSDGMVASYQWNNGAANLGNTASITPSLSVGTHTLTLTVTDNGGATASDSVVVTIAANQAPNVDAGEDQVVTDSDSSGSEVVNLNGSGSDSDGTIVAYEWKEGSTVLGNTASISPSLAIGTHVLTLSVTDNGGATSSDSVTVTVEAAPTGPNLTHGQVANVGSGWQTVTLGKSYTSMVLVATPRYNTGSGPGVVRVNNVTGNSFDVRVDNAGSAAFSGGIHYIAVEEGVYDEPGFKLEAVKYSEAQTSGKSGGWGIDTVSYQQSYTSPVVVGQVMSANDQDFSVFWASGNSRTSPPSASQLNVGKHVAEDTDTTRATETIGYIVIEANSNGSIDGVPFAAGVGSDTVRGVGNGTYQYNYNTNLSGQTAILSSAGMDGGDGGWAVLRGSDPVPSTGSTLSLSVDEDQLRDSERNHTTEQVAYFVIGTTAEGESQTQAQAAPLEITVHDPNDVNGDGYTSPIDVLLVVNHLNSDAELEEGDMALDTNGDGNISPIDALLVINRLNATADDSAVPPFSNAQAIDGYFADLDDEEEESLHLQL